MSVQTDTGAQTMTMVPPAGNPALLGLATFLPGGISLGLWLVGYLPAADLGGIVPAIWLSSGLFLLISCIWATRLGSSAVGAILGIFSAFWLSLGLLVVLIEESLFGIKGLTSLPTFLLSWLIVFVALTLTTLRLPLAFTAGFLFVDIAVALVLAYSLTTTQLYATLAGIAVFIFCAIFAYIWIDGVTQELGGKGMSMGSPVVK